MIATYIISSDVIARGLISSDVMMDTDMITSDVMIAWDIIASDVMMDTDMITSDVMKARDIIANDAPMFAIWDPANKATARCKQLVSSQLSCSGKMEAE